MVLSVIDESHLLELQKWGLEQADKVLKEKSCQRDFNVHSIALIGGYARCYFDKKDNISKHKDIDIDIYFVPIYNCRSRKNPQKLNTQGTPKKEKYEGKNVDIARTVLTRCNFEKSFEKDVRQYAEDHNNSNRWKGSKGKPGRIGNPLIFIFPGVKPIKEL